MALDSGGGVNEGQARHAGVATSFTGVLSWFISEGVRRWDRRGCLGQTVPLGRARVVQLVQAVPFRS